MNTVAYMRCRSSTFKLKNDETYYAGSNISISDKEESEHSLNAQQSIERKPTRVPNLKIQNRNALLARENRKRKKEHLEFLQQDLHIQHEKNKRLSKVIKSQDLKIKKLNNEVQYLKSVLKNQTQIVSILKSFNPNNNKMEENRVFNMESLKSSSDTLSCNSLDDDSEPVDIATDWNEILKSPFNLVDGFSDLPSAFNDLASSSSDISIEHNYYQLNHFDQLSVPGVCLHINSGMISLEFCSVCHENASSSHKNGN